MIRPEPAYTTARDAHYRARSIPRNSNLRLSYVVSMARLKITDEDNQSAAHPRHIYQLVFAARASDNLEDIFSRDRDEYMLPFTSLAVSTALP
jgi:hypothetical protein